YESTPGCKSLTRTIRVLADIIGFDSVVAARPFTVMKTSLVLADGGTTIRISTFPPLTISARADSVLTSKPLLFACANPDPASIVIEIMIAAINFMCAAPCGIIGVGGQISKTAGLSTSVRFGTDYSVLTVSVYRYEVRPARPRRMGNLKKQLCFPQAGRRG